MSLALEEWGEPGSPRVVCLHGITSHGRHFAKLAEALPYFHVLAPDLLGHGSSPYEPPWSISAHLGAVVDTVGTEPAFVVGHSFGGRHFAKLAEALPYFRVLAPDLLGHGSSPYEPPWSISAHLGAVVDTVGTEPAFVVGHSFGGRLAFELAARAPKLVPRLVLLDPAIRVPPDVGLFAAENARKERAYVSFAEGIDRRYDESQLKRAPRELVEEELTGHLIWTEDNLYRYRYSQAAVVAAYSEMSSEPPPFDRVRVPTLLVVGETSYLPYDHLLDAHRAALGDLLEVVVVPGGHTVLWDALEETSAAVTAFLRS